MDISLLHSSLQPIYFGQLQPKSKDFKHFFPKISIARCDTFTFDDKDDLLETVPEINEVSRKKVLEIICRLAKANMLPDINCSPISIANISSFHSILICNENLDSIIISTDNDYIEELMLSAPFRDITDHY